MKDKTYAFTAILTFVTSLTVGNVAYLFFGYGASALGMLTAGLLMDPVPATAVFLVANTAALGLVAYTHSAFTLLVVGAALVRPLQVFALAKLKRRIGPLGASMGVVLLGTALATVLGLVFYGGDAASTPMTFFDGAFILPAYIIARGVSGGKPGGLLLAGAALTSTFGVFLSASPFWIPVATVVGLAVLLASTWAGLKAEASRRILALTLVAAVVLLPVSLASNTLALSYNTRNAFYPLYPDSLIASQWMQTNSSSSCMQGNIAGAGTVQSGVWGPQRLRVLSTCVTVSGVVEGITPQYGPSNDNDFGIDIRLDQPYAQTLSIGNLVLEAGLMHAEVVPSQQPSLASQLNLMKPGDRITITGALVLDTDHGYGAEIHPVWAIELGPSCGCLGG
ncbi:MAG: hypothetical protein LYZ69_06775 [Nitrososphaerales archaeon]|nr:hypothetical protein [Nitrososphaerales archaeon]